MREYIVETKNLKKYYQMGANTVKALDGVDFRVKNQEFILSGEDFPVYRFLPHRTKGEGFFLAVLRKPVPGTNLWLCEPL